MEVAPNEAAAGEGARGRARDAAPEQDIQTKMARKKPLPSPASTPRSERSPVATSEHASHESESEASSQGRSTGDSTGDSTGESAPPVEPSKETTTPSSAQRPRNSSGTKHPDGVRRLSASKIQELTAPCPSPLFPTASCRATRSPPAPPSRATGPPCRRSCRMPCTAPTRGASPRSRLARADG